MRYERNEETEALLQEVIAQTEDFMDIRAIEPRICVLDCEQRKLSEGRMVFADIKPVSEQYKALCEFDYIITIYTPCAAILSDYQFRILLEHELRHVNIKNGPKGIVFGTIGHDIEDFYPIIDRYGIDWSTVDA